MTFCFYECSSCFKRIKTSTPLSCQDCDHVFYCKDICVVEDKLEHSKICKQLKKIQIKDQEQNHYFEWIEEVSSFTFDEKKLEDFLKHQGVYATGLWIRVDGRHSQGIPYGELKDELNRTYQDPFVLPSESVILSSHPIENVLLSSPPIEKVLLSSPPIENVLLSSHPIESVILSHPIEKVLLSYPPIERDLLSSPLEKATLISPPIGNILLCAHPIENNLSSRQPISFQQKIKSVISSEQRIENIDWSKKTKPLENYFEFIGSDRKQKDTDTYIESDPATFIKLDSWQEYYEWRGFNNHSPICVLMHWSLTVYYIIRLYLTDVENAAGNEGNEIVIHLIGAEVEADFDDVFKELCYLFRGLNISLYFIGPNISTNCDRKFQEIWVDSKCTNLSKKRAYASRIRLTWIHGLYHNVIQQTVTDSPLLPSAHLVIGLNAGLAASKDWIPTIIYLVENKIVSYFTDYCWRSYSHTKFSLFHISNYIAGQKMQNILNSIPANNNNNIMNSVSEEKKIAMSNCCSINLNMEKMTTKKDDLIISGNLMPISNADNNNMQILDVENQISNAHNNMRISDVEKQISNAYNNNMRISDVEKQLTEHLVEKRYPYYSNIDPLSSTFGFLINPSVNLDYNDNTLSKSTLLSEGNLDEQESLKKVDHFVIASPAILNPFKCPLRQYSPDSDIPQFSNHLIFRLKY